MQSGNLARMGNIAVMDHTSTKWWVRLEQGRSHNRVLSNKVRYSMEQLLKHRQGKPAQDRDQERLRLLRSTIRHIRIPLDNDLPMAHPKLKRENKTDRSTKPCSNCGRLDGRPDRPLGGERAVDLIDRAAIFRTTRKVRSR
jgi:hypothetical protein